MVCHMYITVHMHFSINYIPSKTVPCRNINSLPMKSIILQKCNLNYKLRRIQLDWAKILSMLFIKVKVNVYNMYLYALKISTQFYYNLSIIN